MLSLLLTLAGAAWWSSWQAGVRLTVGDAAVSAGSGELLGNGSASRAGRGEARQLPPSGGPGQASRGASSATSGPGSGSRLALPAVPSARSLAPTKTRSRTSATPTAGSPTAGASDVVEGVLRLTNAQRATVGCAALHLDSRLTAAAQGHSTDMATRHYFSHLSPEGQTPWDRARAAGYDQPSAENIAVGYRTPQEVMAGWMGSSGHRANILNCASHALGVGFDSRGFYWTQLFGYL